jgi:hypothetical protein
LDIVAASARIASHEAPPHLIELTPADAAHLAYLVHDGRTEQRVARRA